MNVIESYKERLESRLLEVCTAAGLLNGTLLSSPDLDEAWLRYAPSFYADAVREFNAYPEFCFACAGYLGMAVACLWDQDWTRHKDTPYRFFLGLRGFDDMDDHIADKILRDKPFSLAAMQRCSSEAWHFLLKERPEAGTAEAYRMFLASAEKMFRFGAAIELRRLGYTLEKVL